MKRKEILLISVLILINGLLVAQNLSTALNSIPTNFLFFSNNVGLDVTNQFILKNAGTFYDSESKTDAAYGGGYETYRLEFVTNKNLSIEVIKRADYKYKLSLVDSKDKILATLTLDKNMVIHLTNSEINVAPHFYSIDLVNIPISLLDRVTKIYIIEISDK